MGKFKFYVEYWDAFTEEDDYERGVDGGICSAWDNESFRNRSPRKGFDTVKEALEFVCELNCFDFNIKDWDADEETIGKFHTNILVDRDNFEVKVGSTTYNKWKEGKQKLWNCTLSVIITMVAVRDCTEDDIVDWNK